MKKNSKIDFRCEEETKEQFLHLQETMNVSKEDVFKKGLELYEEEFEKRWIELEEKHQDEFIHNIWEIIYVIKNNQKEVEKLEMENKFNLEFLFGEELKKMMFLSPKEQEKHIPILKTRIGKYKNTNFMIQDLNEKTTNNLIDFISNLQNQFGIKEPIEYLMKEPSRKHINDDDFNFLLLLLMEIGRCYGVLDSILDVKVKDFNDLFMKLDSLGNKNLLEINVPAIKKRMMEYVENLELQEFQTLLETLEKELLKLLVIGK